MPGCGLGHKFAPVSNVIFTELKILSLVHDDECYYAITHPFHPYFLPYEQANDPGTGNDSELGMIPILDSK